MAEFSFSRFMYLPPLAPGNGNVFGSDFFYHITMEKTLYKQGNNLNFVGMYHSIFWEKAPVMEDNLPDSFQS